MKSKPDLKVVHKPEHKCREVGGIVIEQGIPAPQKIKQKRYPFRQMEVGESFAVPMDEYLALRRSAHNFNGRNDDMDFLVRKNVEKNEIRCWRIK